MKCKAIINLYNTDPQYICTISTKSPHIRFKSLINNNKLDCDIQATDKKKSKFIAQTWSFWFFLNELNVSVFYRHCVIRYVNGVEGIPLIIIVQPHREVIDHEW